MSSKIGFNPHRAVISDNKIPILSHMDSLPEGCLISETCQISCLNLGIETQGLDREQSY